MCIFIGALIPMYADVLFLHGFDSSTLSSIMDTIVALVALYAAFSVRHWLKDRVKNKGFEHAEQLIMNMHSMFRSIFVLKELTKQFAYDHMDGSDLNESQIQKLKLDSSVIQELSEKENLKASELITSLHSLKTWDMTCHYEEKYTNYIYKIENVRRQIDQAILEVDTSNHLARKKTWLRSEVIINNAYEELRLFYTALDVRFENAFSYTPPKPINK